MKLELDQLEIATIPAASWDDLLAAYRKDETDAGRPVPSYAWETLALLLGGWLAKKLADEAWRRVVGMREKRAAKRTAAEEAELQRQRHDEILRRIGELQATVPDKEAWLAHLGELAKQKDVRVRLVLETDAERDLRDALKKALPSTITIEEAAKA
jgi:hypothetical protein